MLKKLLGITLVCCAADAFATETVNLYHAPLSNLKHFSFKQEPKKMVARAMSKAAPDTANNSVLQEVNQTKDKSQITTRYQQLYHGIPVVGAQVMISTGANQKSLSNSNAQVNGHLLEHIQLNTQPALSKQQALDIAKKSWLNFNPQTPIQAEQMELQIRAQSDTELKLVYQVSFKSIESNNKPAWPFFLVDAQTGELIKQWNNVKSFADVGPGGNEKVHEYWYGKEGLPALEVQQAGAVCTMESPMVKLVNLNFAWDWSGIISTPFSYQCNNNQEELINGAFSPKNDAYYFGHTIVNMYRDWYGVNALQKPDGSPSQLVMRVHFGSSYDNAFWDGQSMSFGDGAEMYPLVSLDVAGHEVTHGFTEQHSNLEYYDQSGALNESLSDMGGQAARAYLLETTPQLYNKVYLQADVITWGIGETIMREEFGKALRFMDYPSSDGSSADCMDKSLAQSNGAYCAISYDDVVNFAQENIPGPQNQQSFIVHTASGIFNKAFYLMAKNIGIKKAYHVMVIANSKYWTPTTNFVQGACGVLYGARDLAVDTNMVKTVFGQVGVPTSACVL
jgi:vibriolysin